MDNAQLVVDNLTTAILLFDSSLRLLDANTAAEAMLEASRRRLRGQRVDQVFLDSEYWRSILTWAMETKRPFTERDVNLRRLGAGEITVDCTVTPLTDRSEGLLVELVQVDSQRRISREELLMSQHEAAQLLVRGLAHEIRNPLGGLRGAAQLLERELTEPALKEYTDVVIGEADRLQSLLDRLLGPRTLPQKKPVNIHQVAERVCRLVKAEAPEAVSFSCDYDPSIPEIEADPDLLIQAILNIARNAVQAVGGEGEICVRTRIQRQANVGHRHHRLAMRMDIVDNGPGIDRDLLEKVFYPMVSGRSGGTGLGLSIAQSLIQQHGGLVQCSSRPGETVMSIVLPLENGE